MWRSAIKTYPHVGMYCLRAFLCHLPCPFVSCRRTVYIPAAPSQWTGVTNAPAGECYAAISGTDSIFNLVVVIITRCRFLLGICRTAKTPPRENAGCTLRPRCSARLRETARSQSCCTFLA